MSLAFNRLRGGERMVALGAVALLVSMFFFKWFAIKVPAIIGIYLVAANLNTSVDAWHSLEVIRWLLLFTVAASCALVVLAASTRTPHSLVQLSAFVTGLGLLSAGLVLYRALANHPFAHTEVKLGAWLGLASCALIALGGSRAMTEATAAPARADVLEQTPAPAAPLL